ncbi:MAG: hypothetical protein ACOYXR_09490 [Nitrospirota bacterium]
MYHIGIKVWDSLDELRAAIKDLELAGVEISGMSDHTVFSPSHTVTKVIPYDMLIHYITDKKRTMRTALPIRVIGATSRACSVGTLIS